MVTDSSSFRFQLATDFEFHDLVEEKVLEKNLTTVTNLSPNITNITDSKTFSIEISIFNARKMMI